MSAFLGKIHYWLYNKIQLHEALIEEVAQSSANKGFNAKELLEKSYLEFGYPVKGNLENEIEHSNIHGWLQEKIIRVEQRLAYVTTELLKSGILSKEDIADIFRKNAQEIMNQIDIHDAAPQDIFTFIFDYMLEGMPCDRVNEIIENNSTKISWKTTMCLHEGYWNAVGGNINNFYFFRDSWINGFLGASGINYRYNRTEDAVNTIERV
ncbi:hypothetical protein [Pseudobacteroides cellulosolvens]|uniref:Uncharacterized protein n=1 Tax=Pseudobacteroides cellulosolvens ATCC 35603 = DSM 2933 TaxID=398512 RepID=A0A0L6JU70_9FIRM|nr:hypothetical protein [Pseudobacteroides cellulosolvens]KNY28977.1 hypothetical protein Bccel_4251 [Pseudobacteroides cellulosolvens ATCC 35603 = DSM 2933]